MVNFPLSGAKSPAFFCDCEAKELRVSAHPVRMHSMIFGVAELRMEATPRYVYQTQSLPHKRWQPPTSCGFALRMLRAALMEEILQRWTAIAQDFGSSTTRCAWPAAAAIIPRRRISATTREGSPELSTRWSAC